MYKDKITYLIGDELLLERLFQYQGSIPFSDELICFFDDWSKEIRETSPESQRVDVASFGFFIRLSHVKQLKEEYADYLDARGRGVILHFVPSNIPSLFAYSMTTSLLAGNAVILRLPSEFETGAELLLETLKKVLLRHTKIAERIVCLQYPHEKEITDYLSGRVDGRIVWGGNRAISEITRSPLKDDAVEILFPDRKSLAVFEAKTICEMNEEQLAKFAQDFYNDTYLTDQNACSSPSLIYWMGEEIKPACERFWNSFGKLVSARYELQEQLAVLKYETALLLSANVDGARLVPSEFGNCITRVALNTLTPDIWQYVSPGGYFIEAQGKSLTGLCEALTSQCQTVVYCGARPDLDEYVKRTVPVGHSLDFSFCWEDTDLFLATIMPC